MMDSSDPLPLVDGGHRFFDIVGVQLYEFLYPWIFIGKHQLQFVNHVMYNHWKRFLDCAKANCRHFHPKKLFYPLYDDRHLLNKENFQQLSIKEYRLNYVKNLCSSIIHQLLVPPSKKAAENVVSVHQLEVSGYCAVQMYSTAVVPDKLAKELYNYFADELVPSLLPQIHELQIVRKPKVFEYHDESSCSTLADYIFSVYRLYTRVGHSLLRVFKYLDRFHVEYLSLPTLQKTLDSTFQNIFISKLTDDYDWDTINHSLLTFFGKVSACNERLATRKFHAFIAMARKFMAHFPDVSHAVAATQLTIGTEELNQRMTVLVIAPHINDCHQITCFHPILSMSHFLGSLLTNVDSDDNISSFNRKSCVINIPDWRDGLLSFAEYYMIDPLPELPRPLTSTKMSDMVPKFYSDFVENMSMGDLFSCPIG
jgi:hypothetical protein